MQSFLVSTSVVALAEIGDKTQLLSLVLAARYRRPWPIILGIFVATLANHGLAGGIGDLLAGILKPEILNWLVVASFLTMAGWVLIPDRLDDDDAIDARRTLGVFGTTVLTFFLAEMGDKTQVATVALAARYHEFLWVVAGTTLGMLAANVPVIILGERFAHRLPVRAVHGVAAVVFVVMGGLALIHALNGGPAFALE